MNYVVLVFSLMVIMVVAYFIVNFYVNIPDERIRKILRVAFFVVLAIAIVVFIVLIVTFIRTLIGI